jgi:hypothetical protein
MDLKVNGLYLSEAILQEFGLGEAPYVNPQEVQLNKLFASATEPWEKAHYEWRIKRLQDQIALAGEPGGGSGAPVDSKGNLIPVLPAREWIKKNPSLVKEMPSETLPPEMRPPEKPGMMNKIKGALGINENNHPQIGDIGDMDQDDIANIQDPNAFEWQAVRNQLIDAKEEGVPAEEIAKLQARYDQLAGDKADAWEKTYTKHQTQQEKDQNTYSGKVQYLDPKSGSPIDPTTDSPLSESLDRIKSLTSRVLRG